jgi:hypothetical protein
MAYELDREICIIAVGMLLLAKIWQSGRCFNAFLKSQRQNKVFLTLGTLFLFLFIGRLVYAVDDFYLPYLVSPAEVVLWGKLGGLFDALGIGILFLLLEIQQFHGKDKYVFFIGYLTFVILYLVTPDLVLAQIFMLVAQLFNFFIVYMLVNMIVKYKGEVRIRALKILLGWALFIISTVITYSVPVAALSTAFGVSIYVVNIVAFAIKIVGVTVLADGYL